MGFTSTAIYNMTDILFVHAFFIYVITKETNDI